MTRLDEAIGKSPEELIDPGAAAQVRTMAAAALRGERVAYERPMTPDPADERWVSVSISGDFDEDGTPRGVYIIAYDISDSKRSESDRAAPAAADRGVHRELPAAARLPRSARRAPAHEPRVRGVHRAAEGRHRRPHRRRGVRTRDRGRLRPAVPAGARRTSALHGEHAVSLSGGTDRRFVSSDWLPDVDERRRRARRVPRRRRTSTRRGSRGSRTRNRCARCSARWTASRCRSASSTATSGCASSTARRRRGTAARRTS